MSVSLLVHGPEYYSSLLAACIKDYKTLCSEGKSMDDLRNISTEPATFELSTKYYSALLNLCVIPLSVPSTTPSLELEDVEGIILMPSKDMPDLSNALYELVGRLEDSQSMSLRVIVVVKDTIFTAHHEAYQLWAIDNGFEVIEIDLMASNLTEGHQTREKVGLPRLMEALDSTLWSNMITKEQGSRSLPSSALFQLQHGSSIRHTAEEEEEEEKEKKEFSTDNSTADKTIQQEDILHSSTGKESKENQQQQQQQQQQPNHEEQHKEGDRDRIKVSESKSKSESELKPNLDFGENFEKEGALPQEMDAMANFIEEAKTFRAQVQSGNMSDEQRRHQASMIALKMSQIMGLGEDSEEDDDEEED